MAEISDQDTKNKVIIDARAVPDRQKKTYFFSTFDNLNENEEMIIINSHDASPLQKLYQQERPGLTEWKYLLEGPPLWKISIKKVSSEKLTVSDIISINPEAIYILSDYSINFYTNLNSTLKNLSLNKRENYTDLINKCLNYKARVFKAIRPSLWSVNFLVYYIIENHHRYLHQKLPEIQDLLQQLAINFGSDYPHLLILQTRFEQFKEEIIEHLKDEEEKIFPVIKKISEKDRTTEKDRSVINDKLNWIIEDHYLTGDNLQAIRKLCNNYQSAQDEIPGIKLLYQELIELEKDFLLHILFENHFLFEAVNRKLKQ